MRQPAAAWVLLRACRLRQWLKNTVVVIAPAAAGAMTRPGVLPLACGALVSFCLLSSATYLVNDVRDRDADRRHPRKRLRPVAAGELAPSVAMRIAFALATMGVVLSAVVRPVLALVAVGYLALTLSYSAWWRNVVVADIVAVAGGFLLRAIAGGSPRTCGFRARSCS
jgi:decaprenyl-phosphate phosphoribosyltransferase